MQRTRTRTTFYSKETVRSFLSHPSRLRLVYNSWSITLSTKRKSIRGHRSLTRDIIGTRITIRFVRWWSSNLQKSSSTRWSNRQINLTHRNTSGRMRLMLKTEIWITTSSGSGRSGRKSSRRSGTSYNKLCPWWTTSDFRSGSQPSESGIRNPDQVLRISHPTLGRRWSRYNKMNFLWS